MRPIIRKPAKGEQRTAEQLWSHYQIERGLASALKNAPAAERGALYAAAYDELFRRVPLHPGVTRKASAALARKAVERQIRWLKPFIRDRRTFLEIGAGDCTLSFALARRMRQVYAVDVSSEITRAPSLPRNVELLLSDGVSIPVPPDSIDCAYSHQLMEHLHPEDAANQLTNVYRALAPGGVYVCITPSRLSGPHDISGYFDRTPSGLHLKEYTIRELTALFRATGFSAVAAYAALPWGVLQLPLQLMFMCEALLERLPWSASSFLARRLPLRPLLGICMVGKKRARSSAV